MSFAQNGEVRLYYEILGPRDAEPVLMINGAGGQSIDVDDGFCEVLIDAGFQVIRFDHRDTGLSSALASQPSRLVEVYQAVKAGERPPLAYDLTDLAGDAFAILDAEGLSWAHVFGRSMGSAVALAMALAHPERVRTLTLVIAFSRGLIDTLPLAGVTAIADEVIPDLDAYIARRLRSARAIGSPAYFDEDYIVRQASLGFSRGVHPGAIARHFAVGLGAPDLRAALAGLMIPTLIVHGALDRMVPLAYAIETAQALPCARLEVIEDMGHDGPPAVQQRWAALFLSHIEAVRRDLASGRDQDPGRLHATDGRA